MAHGTDDLKKLSPRERIERLKKIEQERKKEIEDAEALIRESEEEIKGEAETLAKIPIPQMRSIDPSTLFSREEKAIFETHHQTKAPGHERASPASTPAGEKKAESLEETLGQSAPVMSQEQGMRYGKALEESLAHTYKTLSELSQKANEKGYLNASEQQTVDFYKHKFEDIQQGLQGHSADDGHNHGGVMGLVGGGLERISEMEQRMGYSQKGQGQGANPKYRL